MKKYSLILFLALGFQGITHAQTLDDYFKIAAKNNPGLQARYLKFEAAMQKVAQVNSLPDPKLSFGYFISPIETRVGPQVARFSLIQQFPWFGTLAAQGNAANLLAKAKYQLFLDAKNRLFYQVAAAYYPLYELDEMIAIETENIRILESYKAITISKFENGKGAMVDILRVDIRMKDAKTNLSILKQKRKPLSTQFNNLLNRADDEPISFIDSLEVKPFPEDYRKDSLIIKNPLIDNLDLKIEAGKAQEEVAIKQGLPKMGVGLDYSIIGSRTDVNLPDNGQDAFVPTVSLSIPIFRKKYNAAQKEAQMMRESYIRQREDVINNLHSTYEMAQFEVSQQFDLLFLYEQQIKETQRSLNLLFTAYGNSGQEFEEVLRMQQQLLKYQKFRATALVNYQTALAELNYITAKTY